MAGLLLNVATGLLCMASVHSLSSFANEELHCIREIYIKPEGLLAPALGCLQKIKRPRIVVSTG